MKKMKYIIPLLLFLSLGACTSDDLRNLSQNGDPQSIQFSAYVDSKGSNSTPTYEADYFKEGDQIRIYCPVRYSQPSFDDTALGNGMYLYGYTKTEGTPDNWPYKFTPVGGAEQGFDWRTLEPTSAYYMFEAMYFPQNAYYTEVEADQRTKKNLDKADMLIAYHGQLVKDKGKPVRLTFYHAFAMVKVEITLPVHDTPLDGPFPADAIKDVYMRAMLRGYEVNYSEAIDNDGVRTVMAKDNEAPGDSPLRKDVFMYRVSKTEKVENEKKYETYVYCGIVPQQKFLNEGKDFLFFQVERNDGSGQGEYRYVPNTPALTLRAGHILNLKLAIDSDTHEVVVLSAEVAPWEHSESDMEISPIE